MFSQSCATSTLAGLRSNVLDDIIVYSVLEACIPTQYQTLDRYLGT